MFSMVSQFSSSVFLIGLRSFLPSSHFFSMILRSMKLAFKKRGNCNNVMFGAESSHNGSYITTIIQNFTLVTLTSTVMLHPVGLPLGAAVSSFPMYLTPYALNSLCTCFFTHLTSHHYVCVLAGKIFHLDIYLRLSTYQSMQFIIFNLCST